MKVPKVRRLPSGAWTCQLRIDGKSISITDPDPDVVLAKAYAYKSGVLDARRTPDNITVGQALERYLDARQNVCSPATMRGYRGMQDNRFKHLQTLRLGALSKGVLQREINAEAALVSPKTLQNAYSLFSSAMREAGYEPPGITLKQVPPSDPLFLEPDQIKILMAAVVGSRDEVPILLALLSCRRSEIYGLDWADVDMDKRQIKIKQAVVLDENNQPVTKDMPKNSTSARIIPIIDQLYTALERETGRRGRVVTGNPNNLYDRVNTICRRAGLPEVGVHGLRHSFASLAYHLRIPEKIAMQLGGWSNDQVMKRIYTHLAQQDINNAAESLINFFNC